jgi:hypothetical protein
MPKSAVSLTFPSEHREGRSVKGVGGQLSNQKPYHGVLWEEVLKHAYIKLEGPNACRLSALSRLIGSWYFMYYRQFTKFTSALYPLT